MKNIIENAKQIVCIVPKGRGRQLVEAMSEELEVYNSNFSHARGVGRSSDVNDRGVGEQQEKDVFAVTVAQDKADEVFEFLFYKAELDKPRNGLIYMQATPKTSIMSVPELSSDE